MKILLFLRLEFNPLCAKYQGCSALMLGLGLEASAQNTTLHLTSSHASRHRILHEQIAEPRVWRMQCFHFSRNSGIFGIFLDNFGN